MTPLGQDLRTYEGRPAGPPAVAKDAVNEAMIRHWCETIGDDNPVYTDLTAAESSVHGGIVAPPAMLQAWTMPGYRVQAGGGPPPEPHPDDAGAAVLTALRQDGYTAIVATNCEQAYHRYLRPGDRLVAEPVVESVSDEKATGIGRGHFVTRTTTYRVDGEAVATMRFRLFVFRPQPSGPRTPTEPPPASPPSRPRPAVNADNAFFWEGLEARELRLQRCTGCGRVRYPPRPMCPGCNALQWEVVRASGRGHLYSYVVHHHPRLPGFDPPYLVALVELEEGPRLVTELEGVEPEEVAVGMPLEVGFPEVDGMVLHRFRPAGTPEPQRSVVVEEEEPVLAVPTPTWVSPPVGEVRAGDALPDLDVAVTRSLVVATALASRDYEPIHHDPEAARERGLRDVFMNILSLNGFVGRYATDWAGADAVVKEIAIRLGVQTYPGDVLRLRGQVSAVDGGLVTLEVRGTTSLGDAVTGTVRLMLPEGER